MMRPQKVQLNYKNMASKKGNGCVLSFKLMLKFKPYHDLVQFLQHANLNETISKL